MDKQILNKQLKDMLINLLDFLYEYNTTDTNLHQLIIQAHKINWKLLKELL